MENVTASEYGYECPVLSVKTVDDGPSSFVFKPSESYTAKFESSVECGVPLDFHGVRDMYSGFTEFCSDTVGSILNSKTTDFRFFAEKIHKAANLYGSRFPFIKLIAGEWLCDLCLVTRLYGEIPYFGKISDYSVPFAKDFTVGSFIKKYAKKDFADIDDVFDFLSCMSGYDICSSPFYEKNSDIYRKALCYVIPAILGIAANNEDIGFLIPEKKTVRRSPFIGLPVSGYCGSMTVVYIPYSENTDLYELVTAAVKHTENLLRQGIGSKTKVMGFTLSSEYRKGISDTLRNALPGFLPQPAKVGRKPREKTEENPIKQESKEEIFEPLDLNIDFTKAKKLEAESWKIAELLGADYGGNDLNVNVEEIYGTGTSEKEKSGNDKTANADSEADVSGIPEEWREFYLLLSEDEKKILCLVSNGISAAAFAKKRGGMLSGFVDSVNEKAFDTYGDVVIETDGITVGFIEDYKEELTVIFRDLYNTEVL